MKHETETPSLTKLQEERLKEIREIEFKLYYESRLMDESKFEKLKTKMETFGCVDDKEIMLISIYNQKGHKVSITNFGGISS